jgi:hypothetical protein
MNGYGERSQWSALTIGLLVAGVNISVVWRHARWTDGPLVRATCPALTLGTATGDVYVGKSEHLFTDALPVLDGLTPATWIIFDYDMTYVQPVLVSLLFTLLTGTRAGATASRTASGAEQPRLARVGV